jgi:hypothetical protein
MGGKTKTSKRHLQPRGTVGIRNVETVRRSRIVPTENFLEELIKKILEKLNNNDYQPTVSDAIKAIQLKQKLNKTSEGEKIFWELIDKIRKEELGKMESKDEKERGENGQ